MQNIMRNLVTAVSIAVVILLPTRNIYAQYVISPNFMNSKPIVGSAPSTIIPIITKNSPTPLEVIGNAFNPYVAVDDTNSYNSYKEWIGRTTRDERIALIDSLLHKDDLDTKIDSLKKNEGWVCGDISTEMQIKIGQISNEDEFIKTIKPSGGSFFKGDNEIRIPVYQFTTITPISKEAHSINGALVGDSTGNMDPTNFNAWYFWSNYLGWDKMNIKPGDSEMGDGPVSMGLAAYFKGNLGNSLMGGISDIVKWDLKNGVATLDSIDMNWGILVLKDPNIIKVHSAKLNDIVVDAKNTANLSPENLEALGFKAFPDTTSENADGWSGYYPWYGIDDHNIIGVHYSYLSRSFPINVSYFDSDTTWSTDSTSYSFNREFYAWIYSGGITQLDSTSQKITLDNLSGIGGKENTSPDNYFVYQNFPNPFNPSTVIKYSISKSSFVKLELFNTIGQLVKTLVNEERPQGNYSVTLDGSNLPSGVYFYRLQAGSFTQVKKLVLLK